MPRNTDTVAIDVESVVRIPKETEAKPRREGSKVANFYAAYKDGITVAKWLEAVRPLGGGLSNLRKDLKVGRITLEAPKASKKAA
mgnify:CR=1 FL=1|jgi:hypothetical protein|tara:strand:- start:182 stop:436 length:255 start_codon:yes stop_codon:yes gene_type:complete